MNAMNELMPEQIRTAVLDDAHVGDIHGALGTIRQHDHGPRVGLFARWKTLIAIIGPGLIVMVGDNDAGAFGTYTQAGQNYGTTLLWTLMLLIPVLYVNQEMVVRLGAVTGVGHARLIFERFGKFSLNALTIVTEFIGISLALNYSDYPSSGGCLPLLPSSWPRSVPATSAVSNDLRLRSSLAASCSSRSSSWYIRQSSKLPGILSSRRCPKARN
jgi:Natural resistance-associated macrophage protein